MSGFSTRQKRPVWNFHELRVWQKAHSLALSAYRVTGSFPPSETYGLTSQIRRSASSIAANLAEGCGRGSDAELARFAQIARGSASELEYHFLLAHDLDLIPSEEYERLSIDLSEIQKMLTSFRQRLSKSPSS